MCVGWLFGANFDDFFGASRASRKAILVFNRCVMAKVIARDPASVLVIDHGVCVVCPLWVFTSKRMLTDVAASRINFDNHVSD